jgi:hypothetical protein
MNLGDFLTLVLGGGAVATVGAVFKGVQALRAGARSREKEAVDDLEKWRVQAVRRAERAEEDRDYYRDYASQCRFLLRENGIEPPPLEARRTPELTGGKEDGD